MRRAVLAARRRCRKPVAVWASIRAWSSRSTSARGRAAISSFSAGVRPRDFRRAPHAEHRFTPPSTNRFRHFGQRNVSTAPAPLP